MPSQRAIIWSIFGAYMALPVNVSFDFPGVPALDKFFISNLAMLGCALMFARHKVMQIPKHPIILILLAVYVVSPFLTALNNQDPLILSTRAVPGMSWYDAVASCVNQAVLIIPFIVGYNALSREQGHREILYALGIGAILYTLPILYEIRLSPQLHNQIYGFFPHSFAQQVRDGGYRPVVFMGHGLLVAIFIAMAFIASIGLWRQKARLRGVSFGPIAAGLFVLLILCKSFGAMLLALVFAPMLYFLKSRYLVTFLAVIAFVVVSYPQLRGAGLIPVNAISSFATSVSEERAKSFSFRLENEDKLLAKANKRPFFGWGTWGRNQIYASGYMSDKVVSITDGLWVIIIGSFGWMGYIATFGLLCVPFLRAFKYRRYPQWPLSTLALLTVLTINLIDLIPNASNAPLLWMIAGALSGMKFARRQPSSVHANEVQV